MRMIVIRAVATLPATTVYGVFLWRQPGFRSGARRPGLPRVPYLNVHHRYPGDHTRLVMLCSGCHARVHRTRILRWLILPYLRMA